MLVDDSPYKSLLDPENTISIPTFTVSDPDWDYEDDTSLFSVLKYLEAYQQGPHVSIQDFIRQTPFSRINETTIISSSVSNASSPPSPLQQQHQPSSSPLPPSPLPMATSATIATTSIRDMDQDSNIKTSPANNATIYHRQLHAKSGAYMIAKQQEPVVEILQQWTVCGAEIDVYCNNRPKFRYLIDPNDPMFRNSKQHQHHHHHQPLTAEQFEAKMQRKEERRRMWLEQQQQNADDKVEYVSRRGKIKKGES